MTWATIEDVKKTTGATVTDDVISQAGASIELRTGVMEDTLPAYLGTRDGRYLKLAVCYQAAWLAPRPDAFERDDVTSVGQDGQSAALKDHANTLAPHARLALKRLSWRGTRSTTTATGDLDTDVELDVHGRPLQWKPMTR